MTKSLLGFTLLLVGIAIIVFGMFLALRPVVAMYQEAINDPMGASAQAAEPGQAGALDNAKDDVPRQMFKGIAIGAVGLMPLLIGTVLLKIAMFQRMRRSRLFNPAAPMLATPPNPLNKNPFAR